VKKHLDFLSKYENQIKLRFRSDLYMNLGNMHVYNNEFDKSITYLKRNNFKPNDYYSQNNLAWTYYFLMFNFMELAQHDSAIIYGKKGLLIFEKEQDKIGQFEMNANLINIYSSINNYKEAEKYLHKNIAIAKEANDSTKIFFALNDLQVFYYTTQKPLLSSSIDSLVNFQKKWQSKDPKFIIATQSALAYKYLKDSNYVETNKILQQLAPLFPLVNYKYFTYFYENTLSEYENAMRKPLTLKKLYLERLKEAKISGELLEEQRCNSYLGKEAESLNDYKTAYKYLQDENIAHEKYLNAKVASEAIELDKKYQTEKKEAQIKQQADEAAKKNVFIAFLAFGLLAFIYFYSLLKKKNTVIAQQNELNEQTISILSHDIKEPLLGVKLLLKKINKDDPFVAQASQSLENQINSVNGILTNLLRMKKLSFAKKDKNATANVNTVVKNVIQELNVAIQSKDLIINNEINEDFTVPIAQEKLQIVVHNLLSNAVKYSFPHQSIRIFQEGNGFSIQDFGVGLSPEQRSKIMREVTASQQGTKQERGNGLGLFLIGTLLQGEQLKVIFDSPEVGGTIVKVLNA
jgi:signal transduction histidine kinase